MTTLVRNMTVFMAEHPTNGKIYIVERTRVRGGGLKRWTWSCMPKVFSTPKEGADQAITRRNVPRIVYLQARLHFIWQDLPDEYLDADKRSALANARDALIDAETILRTVASPAGTPALAKQAKDLQTQALGWMTQFIEGDQ